MASKKSPEQRLRAYQRCIPGMTDSHFHSELLEEREVGLAETLKLLEATDASWLIDISIRPGTLEKRKSLCASYEGVRFTSGIHPGAVAKAPLSEALARMDAELADPAVVAAGEMGLDWVKMYAGEEEQRRAFQEQIRLANSHGKPIVIHNRGADEAVFEILEKTPVAAGGIMHCFSSGIDSVERALELGMHVSFAGNVTYKSGSEELQEACRRVPPDRLLLETDAPFLAPQAVRGRPNSPVYVGHTYDFVAELRSTPVEELVRQVAANLEALFGLA